MTSDWTLADVLREQAVNESWPKPRVSGHLPMIKAVARRAGLEYEESDRKVIFRRDGVIVGGLNGMLPHTTNWLAVRVCKSKQETRKVLAASGVPVPVGEAFELNQMEESLRWAREFSGRLVVKPAHLEGGKGVVADIAADDVPSAWRSCIEVIYAENTLKRRQGQILLEEYVPGLDIRCMVVANRMVAATARLAANVEGDGKSSIGRLIKKKNRIRRENPYLKGKLIRQDEWAESHLRRAGLDLDTVLPAGGIAWLSSAANISQGGDGIDVTTHLNSSICAIAEAAISAIPGMDTGGVDLRVPSLFDAAGCAVIEVNTSANIGVHHYPWRGKPQDVAGAWVESLYLVGARGGDEGELR